MEEISNDQITEGISLLPEHILLHVFTYLTIKERCSASRVSQTWRRIAADPTLWRHVNLYPYRIDLAQLKQIIRKRFSSSLLSLQLKGFLDTASVSKQIITEPMLLELMETCPNLQTLQLHQAQLTLDVTLKSFPATLESLALRDCMIPMEWFKTGLTTTTNRNILPKLKHLDMTGSSKMSDADLKACVQAWPGLVTLHLNSCYRITPTGLLLIPQTLNDLVVLELSETNCDHGVLHHLCRNLHKLETLNLSGCRRIGAESVAFVRVMTNLKVLNLSKCALGPSVTLSDFTHNVHLKHLDLRETGILPNQILDVLPRCTVLL